MTTTTSNTSGDEPDLPAIPRPRPAGCPLAPPPEFADDGLWVRDPHGMCIHLVEAQAESAACPRCDGKHEVVEHVAVTVLRVRLREARLRCRQCGTRRSLWFRINDIGPN